MIESIAPSIHRMGNLVTLDLAQNLVFKLPMDISGLSSLVELFLSGNPMEMLPWNFGLLKSLVAVEIDTEKMCLPPQVVCSRGAPEMKRFMTSLAKGVRDKMVDIRRCGLPFVPKEICELRAVTTVRLDQTGSKSCLKLLVNSRK